MNEKGMTIVELIIVLAIIGIISTFTIVNVTSAQKTARIKADTHNIVVLNQMTQDYLLFNGATSGDIFFGFDTDEDRINRLVNAGYLSTKPVPAQSGATYIWNIEGQYWTINGGELSISVGDNTSSFDFSVDFKEALAEAGVVFRNPDNWYDEDGYLENKPGEQRLFVPIGATTYSITVSAALSTGSGGGYGIFFDTILIDGDENKDSGYILQFDRGYGDGAFIVRPRSNGSEQNRVWEIRGSNSDDFPSKTEDPEWWSSTHSITITVTQSGGTNRSASFYIDGTLIGTFNYSKDIGEEVLYTGFRTWSNPTTKFYSINVN